MINLFKTLFDFINVRYTNDYLYQTVRNEPYEDSMFGICSVLSKYGIGCECVKLVNKEEITLLCEVCIVSYNGGYAILCPAKDEKLIHLLLPNGKQTTVKKENFIEHWDGAIIALHKNNDAIEPNYHVHKKEENVAQFKKIIAISALAVLFFAAIIYSPLVSQWQFIAILAINILGLGVSFLLLQKQLHIPNKFTEKLCGLAEEGSCDEVTNSDGSTLFGLFKLSEIGGAFFIVNFAFLLLSPGAAGSLALIAVCSLPFTLWSVWYQKFKVKQWCVLCLMTLALMWAQTAVYLLWGAYFEIHFDWAALVAILASYGLAVCLINKAMTFIENRREADYWHLRFNELRTRDDVVDAIENKAPEFVTDADKCSSLLFGDADAQYQITIFSNPYCGPCAMMHKRIANLPGYNVSIRYVLTSFSEELSKINRYIVASYFQLGSERTWQLLTEWYSGGKTKGESFFDPYDLDIYAGEVENEFEKHLKWSENENLKGTPTVIIGGREVLDPYSVEDYIYMTA